MVKEHPRGNPNPSPATRFGAGQRGNPRGKTSEQRQQEIKNAEIATRLRGKFLEAVEGAIVEIETAGLDDFAAAKQTLAKMSNEVLRLMKDSEDRGFGAPKQDMTINDNRDPDALSDEELAAIAAGDGSEGVAGPED